MSEAAFDPEAMLERLALLDMAAAERAHARLMAVEETAEVAELSRSYERAARSVRQTLALHARMRREAAAELRRTTPIGNLFPPRPAGRAFDAADFDDEDLDEGDTDDAPDALETAARAYIRAEYDPSEAERLEDGLDDLIDRLWTDAFAELDVTDQAQAVIARIRAVARPSVPAKTAPTRTASEKATLAKATPAPAKAAPRPDAAAAAVRRADHARPRPARSPSGCAAAGQAAGRAAARGITAGRAAPGRTRARRAAA